MSVDIAKAVSALLRSRPPITTITSSIHFDRFPQSKTPPAIVLWSISETPHMHLEGAVGLDQSLMQIDAYGRTRPEANDLAWTIWTEITGFSGVVDQVFIKGVSRTRGIRHTSDRVKAGTDQYRFIGSQDLLFSYDSINLVIP